MPLTRIVNCSHSRKLLKGGIDIHNTLTNVLQLTNADIHNLIILFPLATGILFRTSGVHARTPQRHVPDGRVLPEQDPRRGTDILGDSRTVHIYHILHGGPKPEADTLPHCYPVHNASQSSRSVVW